jgi:hypothetical protein
MTTLRRLRHPALRTHRLVGAPWTNRRPRWTAIWAVDPHDADGQTDPDEGIVPGSAVMRVTSHGPALAPRLVGRG